MPVSRGDAVGLTRELVRVDSRNPSLVSGGPGEAAVARTLAQVLESWGFAVEVIDVIGGRPNVVARIQTGADNGSTRNSDHGTPSSSGRSLMFNGHLDVVGTDGMDHEPFVADDRDGSMYGRGSCDMKSGVAAMCAAAARAAGAGIEGDLVIAAVCDEEYESAGTRALIERGVRADAAIVTEPTSLAIMPAHLGFAWIDVVVHGRAAHGSRWEIGIDAIRYAGLFLAALDALDHETLPARRHALLGRPSVHASLIDGGTGMSTYPERCTIRVERRTIPGESPEAVTRELRELADGIERRGRARGHAVTIDVTRTFAQAPSDVAIDAPIVTALRESLVASGEDAPIAGMTAWTDAALLNDAGIPAICFGPGDIAHAHAATEFVPIAEIERATTVLAHLAGAWCSGRRERV